MKLEEVRKQIILALCSDDDLLDVMVLKGGNALGLVHGVGHRSSVDIDYSISQDFTDLNKYQDKIFNALKKQFKNLDYVVFDETLTPKPKQDVNNPTWGGYQVHFKLISLEKYEELKGNLNDIRRQSIGEIGGTRKFKIDISKYEYTEGKEEVEIDGHTLYVYTLEMIVAEKLRAICQQIDGYELVSHPRPRARDFYDIFSIVNDRALDFSKPLFLDLVRLMFEAKKVPINYLQNIENQYDFHASDWLNVQNTISENTNNFKFYFDYVLKHAAKLKPLWIE